jgi:uncharacterized protein YndB with AHSA1/START domain
VHEIHDSAEATLQAQPTDLFAAITRIECLPDWNTAIERVIDQPTALKPGASWTVEMHPTRLMRWRSVSTVQLLDEEGLRFAYRTVNADGNPSHALSEWSVQPANGGALVRVRWDVFLETLDRQLLGGPIRRRQLRREVAASLGRLGSFASR